ncbi:MAG: hypothetical protein KGR26_14685, partial [Cyanobacteria bacterium REEB65]|nr:hypothetical protein [Cyanobacteria bacterium REEB65]
TSVDHFVCTLYQAGPSPKLIEQTQTPAGSGVADTVDWAHLKAQTAYLLSVSAFDSSGNLLNAGGSPATADVTTRTDDQVSVDIDLQLANVVFDGTLHPVVAFHGPRARKVDHLGLALSEASGSAWIPLVSAQTPAGSRLSQTVDFSHLPMDATFQLSVTAFDPKGHVIASTVATTRTTNNDQVDLPVTLGDGD